MWLFREQETSEYNLGEMLEEWAAVTMVLTLLPGEHTGLREHLGREVLLGNSLMQTGNERWTWDPGLGARAAAHFRSLRLTCHE